jgi:hypothetical protein
LKKQMELIRRGNTSDVELLGKQAGFLVEKIAQTGLLESVEFNNQRERLASSYQALCLAVTAQKTDTIEQLKQVRKCRNTLKTYRNNI